MMQIIRIINVSSLNDELCTYYSEPHALYSVKFAIHHTGGIQTGMTISLIMSIEVLK